MHDSRDVTVETTGGRTLEVVVDGPEDGLALVFHSGTPSAAGRYGPIVDAASARGLRTVAYSRPGYSQSTAQLGRTVADATADVTAILDELGHDRFVTLGWSGGGPHALACAALLPERCAAATSLAGVAPYDADGLDWLAGMGEENIVEFGAALDGFASISSFLESQAPGLRTVTAGQVADSLGGLVSDIDRAVATDEFAEYLAAQFRASVSTGVAGWRDDDLAFAAPWGFELASIAVPVSVWQGGQDRMVPYSHGQWLASHLPTANSHLYEDEGHLSVVAMMPAILDDLVERAAG